MVIAFISLKYFTDSIFKNIFLLFDCWLLKRIKIPSKISHNKFLWWESDLVII